MRKLASMILAITLAVALITSASAVEVDNVTAYTYSILVDEPTVALGDIITVSLVLTRADGTDDILYGMQDYLCFDPAYFTYVEDSIWVMDDVDGAGEEGFRASPLEFEWEEVNRVFVNRTTSYTMAGESTKILSVQMKAIQIGTTELTHHRPELLEEDTTLLPLTAINATVTIAEATTGGTGDTGNSGNTGSSGGSSGGTITPTTDTDTDIETDTELTEIELTETEEIPEVAESHFSDVADTSLYYYEAVQFALEMGITSGTSETEFSPDDPCSRGQIVTFLYRAMGEPSTDGICDFEDLDTDSYYGDAVAWAVEFGITSGTGGMEFSPELTCTRGQIVTFLYRLAGEPEVSGDSGFSDVESDSYYASAVLWAVEQGITTGLSNDEFAPDAPCTRAQVVTFLYRYLS